MGKYKKQQSPSRHFLKGINKNKLTTAVIILGIVAVVLLDAYLRQGRSPMTTFAKGRSLGDAGARMTITEFVDFTCHECARGSALLKTYLSDHPQEIFLGVKYYPLAHPQSMKAAVYAECVSRQDRFWDFTQTLFENQIHWTQLEDAEPYFKMVSKRFNLDMNAMNSCISAQDVRKVITAEKTLGDSYFVRATPTYFINKKMVVGVDELEKFLKGYFKDR